MSNLLFPPPATRWTRPIIRAKRYLLLCGSIAWEDFWSPFTDNSALFSYIGVVLTTYLAINAGGLFRVIAEISSINEALLPLAYASLIWLVICLLRAPFRAKKIESDLGHWVGNRFIFNEPKLVFTKQVTAADTGKPIEFEIPEAEPGGGVDIRATVDAWGQPCAIYLSPAIPGSELPIRFMNPNPAATALAVTNSRRFHLFIQKPEPSNPSVVKVYVDSLYIPQQ